MIGEVISFRVGHEQYAEILAECDRLGITKTEYLHRKLSTAKHFDITIRKIKSRLKIALRLFNLFNKPSAAIRRLEELIDWLE